MKRFAIIMAALLLGALSSSAQDIITKKTGEDIRAIVTEVGPDTITYRLYDEDSDVKYTVMKAEVVLIRYESGRNEVITGGSSIFDPLLYGSSAPVAGIKPGMKYRDLKDLYNYKLYMRGLVQNYNPGWCGFASYCIPGLGQMICGEWGRGFAFFGGYMAGYTLMNIGALSDLDIAPAVCLIGLAGVATAGIWSIVDATRVAKVKNMYERDLLRSYAVDVDLYPSVNIARTGSGYQPTAGMTLAVKF
ncbi:MAG: hypothetical protein J6J54_01125 [Bacteroidales bacterium]|nr:hypothetical protein [Bacteroidales bacterium]